MLTFDALKSAVAAGEIDTVVVAFTDMAGQLVGKRFHAEHFVESAHEETHACCYLLANDIDMEPVPGYAAASWGQGYGDFTLKPDMATLRRIPWLEATALVLADVVDHHHHDDIPHSPRAMLKRQIARLEEGGHEGVVRLGARILSVRRELRGDPGEGVPRPEDRGLLHRGLSHLPDDQGRAGDARDPQRPARRGHTGREFQGRVGTGPGRDQRPLRRGARDGGPARADQERLQGDRPQPRQGGHVHGEVALRPRGLVQPRPRFALGRRRAHAAVRRSRRAPTACRR